MHDYTTRPIDLYDGDGTTHGVYDQDGNLAGLVIKTHYEGWKIRDCGIGVDLPHQWMYPGKNEALQAIHDTRATAPALTRDDTGLTRRDRDVLTIASWGGTRREQENAACDLLADMRPAHYWQILNQLLDRPAALIYAPQTVMRLRRARDDARAARSASLLLERTAA